MMRIGYRAGTFARRMLAFEPLSMIQPIPTAPPSTLLRFA